VWWSGKENSALKGKRFHGRIVDSWILDGLDYIWLALGWGWLSEAPILDKATPPTVGVSCLTLPRSLFGLRPLPSPDRGFVKSRAQDHFSPGAWPKRSDLEPSFGNRKMLTIEQRQRMPPATGSGVCAMGSPKPAVA
jgi:hypothetical protein